MELHQRIRMVRLSRNLTQVYVADELGIDVANYSRLERGETKISADRLELLASIFEIEMSHFFGLENESSQETIKTIDLMKEILDQLKDINKKLE